MVGAGEQLATKIGLEAISDDRDLELVDDASQLVDLLAGQELRLVDDKHVDRLLAVARLDHLEQIAAVTEHLHLQLQPDSGADDPRPEAIVDGGGHGQWNHATLQIVEVGLDELGRLARVHGGEFVVQ